MSASLLPKSYLPGIAWPAFTASSHVHLLSLQFQFEHTQWMSADELLELQLLQAQQVIDHAARSTPYYRERFADCDRPRTGALTYDAFRALPILKRSDIQSAGTDLISQQLPAEHGQMLTSSTSGSTGQPITTKATTLTALFLRALGLRFHLWHKRDLSRKNMTIRAGHTFSGEERMANWIDGFDTGPTCRYDISRPTRELFDCLIKEEPNYLQTHPYTLRELIRHSEDTGIKPAGLIEARTFGEVLTTEIRDAAARVWGIPVVDNYSAAEVGVISLQCPETLNHHVQSEILLVEVLDDAGAPCQPGELGRVVCTDLHNFATPLIRYDIGDFAEVGEPCSCGRGLPTLRKIVGRMKDFILLPDGDRVRPVLDAQKMLQLAPIRQYQFIQKTYQVIEVRLVMHRPLTDVERDDLSRYFDRQFRHAFDYQYTYCDEIPRAASGKYEVFRSDIASETAE